MALPLEPLRAPAGAGGVQDSPRKWSTEAGPGRLSGGPWKLIPLWILPYPRSCVKLKSQFLLFKVATIVILPTRQHGQGKGDKGQAKGPDRQECGVLIRLGDRAWKDP